MRQEQPFFQEPQPQPVQPSLYTSPILPYTVVRATQLDNCDAADSKSTRSRGVSTPSRVTCIRTFSFLSPTHR